MARFKYRGTVSSNGRQFTTEPYTRITFDVTRDGQLYNYVIGSLTVETFGSPITIQLNDEEVPHPIPANNVAVFEDIPIDFFTILESGVEYKYTGMY